MFLLLLATLTLAQPTIKLTHDDTRIDRSCIILIDPGLVIHDANGDGVIHIVAPAVTIKFAPGSVLRGSPADTFPDAYKGTAIRVSEQSDVTIQNAHLSGFRVGIFADKCESLIIEDLNVHDNYRQRLKSTIAAEDSSDWLYPHANDNREWLTNHGAAISVHNSPGVTIRRVTVRDSQNGILLDRVTGGRIYDNDCSFLSGWGIAMWRSSGNTISRNALDFCIRGYSHGVYNRGQDSAGLLMFEQCSDNDIVENSITHGGDGVFAFAGKEALGETPAPPGFDHTRMGCNDNIFADNDLSYAAAHGLEITFSHGNQIIRNRFTENAICGIWAGYSTDSLIAGNRFTGNGEMAYGLERGGINIEHGSRNLILQNSFDNDKCAIHLWWDDDAGLLKLPGVIAAGADVKDNLIAGNTFANNTLALHLRSPDPARIAGTVFTGNICNGGTEFDASPGVTINRDIPIPEFAWPSSNALGESRPVGARASLIGRHNIIMTEWGPWDHQSPLVRPLETRGPSHRYEFRRLPPDATFSLNTSSTAPITPRWDVAPDGTRFLIIDAPALGVTTYTFTIRWLGTEKNFTGSLVKADWSVAAFPWRGSLNPPQPPPDLDAWRSLRESAPVNFTTNSLSFNFGSRGPTSIKHIPELASSTLARSLYGLIASTSLPLTKGRWRITTISDDGIRVLLDGKALIENWTHHGPTTDYAEFTLDTDRSILITVEYFQIGGHAELDFRIEPVH